jgi:hypothetical protein
MQIFSLQAAAMEQMGMVYPSKTKARIYQIIMLHIPPGRGPETILTWVWITHNF